jgi:hypothetical protein
MSRFVGSAEQLRGAALTTFLVGAFAAGWGISGSVALPGLAGRLVLFVVLIVTLVLAGLALAVLRAVRRRPGGDGQAPNPFRTRDYQLAVLAEIIAIPLAGRLLTAAGRPDAVMPAVAAIVGLHFFGLVRAFRSWRFAVVGSAMVLVALLGLALPPAVPVGVSGEQLGLRAAAVGLGCALCLWGGSPQCSPRRGGTELPPAHPNEGRCPPSCSRAGQYCPPVLAHQGVGGAPGERHLAGDRPPPVGQRMLSVGALPPGARLAIMVPPLTNSRRATSAAGAGKVNMKARVPPSASDPS